MVKSQTLRFAVTTPDGYRAASWRLWTQPSKWGEEIYLACRELRGAIHTSFHASGQWHTTFSAEAAGRLPSPERQGQRRIEEWPRPVEILPGLTIAYSILTPASAAFTPGSGKLGKLIQIPNAPEGEANMTKILLVRAGTTLQVVNGDLVATSPLSDGGQLAIVNRAVKMPEFKTQTQMRQRFFQGSSSDDLKSEHLRAIAFCDFDGGHRGIVDARVMPAP